MSSREDDITKVTEIYDESVEKMEQARKERKAKLEQFDDIEEKIREASEFPDKNEDPKGEDK